MITLFFLLTFLQGEPLQVTSPMFRNNEPIPVKYTCEGDNVNPPLDIKNIPIDTKSLALIMDDPDAPKGTFDHWIMWNIEPDGVISQNTSPGKEGRNGRGENKYTGPCPPSGTHHYHFKVYALDTKLDLEAGADKKTLEAAMKGHILAEGKLVGTYKKMKK